MPLRYAKNFVPIKLLINLTTPVLFRILPLLLVFLFLPAWGIDRLLLRYRFGKKGRMLYYAPFVVLGLLLLGTGLFESYSPGADRWKAQLLSVTLTLLIPEVFFSLFLVAGALLRRRWARVGRWTMVAGGGFSVLLFLAMAYGMTLGYRHIVVKHYTYADARVPKAFDGYRIVQLSDLHLGTLHGHEDVLHEIVAKVNDCDADLVVFTGDLVNYHAAELDEFRDILSGLKARDGVISVMGNHDYAQYFRWPTPADSIADICRLQEAQRAMGWHLLLNENRIVKRGNDSIAIVGVENDGKPPFPSLSDMKKARSGLDDSCFQILLSHDPTHWRREVLPETDIPLTLSGHTHGMQFMLFGLSPSSWFYDEWGGAYNEDRQTLYVSLGTGQVMIPFRFGAWPEINLIELRKN